MEDGEIRSCWQLLFPVQVIHFHGNQLKEAQSFSFSSNNVYLHVEETLFSKHWITTSSSAQLSIKESPPGILTHQPSVMLLLATKQTREPLLATQVKTNAAKPTVVK